MRIRLGLEYEYPHGSCLGVVCDSAILIGKLSEHCGSPSAQVVALRRPDARPSRGGADRKGEDGDLFGAGLSNANYVAARQGDWDRLLLDWAGSGVLLLPRSHS